MNVVVFCKFRELRPAGGIICPGGIWTCTNPNGHCSCISTCGIKRMERSAEGIGLGVDHESDKGKRREIHLLSA
jgi:hypothetical protein